MDNKQNAKAGFAGAPCSAAMNIQHEETGRLQEWLVDKPIPHGWQRVSELFTSVDSKDALKKEIARIIDDAFTAGFDADTAGALDRFDGFALADASIEKYWPND